MNYAEITEIDIYSEAKGYYTWLSLADTQDQITVAVDYTDTDTVFTYGALKGKIYEGRYLRINKEYIKIISFTQSTITVERAQHGSVAVNISEGSIASQQSGLKIQIADRASLLVEEHHQEPRDEDDTPFGIDDYTDVCSQVALYLEKILPIEEIRSRISILTDGEYSDKNVTLDTVGEFTMPQLIASQIDDITDSLGGDTGAMQRS